MKKILFFVCSMALLFGMSSFASAAVHVNGYYRSNGTYVAPHYRSNPDGNPYNNWSYPGNTNPYTGKTATGNPDTYLKNYYGSSGSSYTSSSYTSPDSYTSPTYVPYTPIYTAPIPTPATYETVPNGHKSYGILFCDSGSYEVNDTCRSAPQNGHAYGGTSFYCDSGYEKSGDQCVKPSVPNAYWDGTQYKCNSGYGIDPDTQTSCVPISNQYCTQYYGPHAVMSSTGQSCVCENTYEWSKEKLLCVKSNLFTSYNFTTDLSAGSIGDDVTELQKFLEAKGFLTIPFGVDRGSFGNMTKNALKQYQKSQDLPLTGKLDYITRTYINSVQ